MKHPVFFLFIVLVFAISCSRNNSTPDHQQSNNIDSQKDPVPTAESLTDTTPFIQYFESNDEQKPFRTRELTKASVTLFPNLGTRKSHGDPSFGLPVKQLNGVYGVNQFFMDFDLTTGFVHEFTQNMYNNLPADGFVLYLDRDQEALNKATIRYKRKKDLTKSDILGQNIGFCRQWKLSEIEIDGEKIFLKKEPQLNCYWIALRSGSTSPYPPFARIWSDQAKTDGYYTIDDLNKLTKNNGGTAVIIWETKQGEIRFIDIHGSIKDIINQLQLIAKKYDVDPTLGVYDAAGMAKKMKADANHVVGFDEIDKWCGGQNWVGAGYGFDISQVK